jgi:hypothetical protein
MLTPPIFIVLHKMWPQPIKLVVPPIKAQLAHTWCGMHAAGTTTFPPKIVLDDYYSMPRFRVP